jgi:hypothetical protein
MKENEDCIRGRRLTNAESMHMMLPDIPDYSEVINEVCKPFVVEKKGEYIMGDGRTGVFNFEGGLTAKTRFDK